MHKDQRRCMNPWRNKCVHDKELIKHTEENGTELLKMEKSVTAVEKNVAINTAAQKQAEKLDNNATVLLKHQRRRKKKYQTTVQCHSMRQMQERYKVMIQLKTKIKALKNHDSALELNCHGVRKEC